MENNYVYSQKIEETMEVLFEHVPEEEEELVIGGDCNARTVNKGGPISEEEEKNTKSEIR